jgi:hypothetical protein
MSSGMLNQYTVSFAFQLGVESTCPICAFGDRLFARAATNIAAHLSANRVQQICCSQIAVECQLLLAHRGFAADDEVLFQ